jgi:hypothetical protein
MGYVAQTMIPADPAQALQLTKEALRLGRETGMSYCGPVLLSIVARLTPNGPERASALAEGEQLLAAGCVSHSYFEFYGNAIEAGLQERDWPMVRRYADALWDYTECEPLPWTDMLIKRARLLADVGENNNNAATRKQLEELRAECLRMNALNALTAVDSALQAR